MWQTAAMPAFEKLWMNDTPPRPQRFFAWHHLEKSLEGATFQSSGHGAQGKEFLHET